MLTPHPGQRIAAWRPLSLWALFPTLFPSHRQYRRDAAQGRRLWALLPTLVLSALASASTPQPSPQPVAAPTASAPSASSQRPQPTPTVGNLPAPPSLPTSSPAAPALAVVPITAQSTRAPSPASERPTAAPTVTNSPAPPTPTPNRDSISAAAIESHLTTIDATLQKLAANPNNPDHTPAWITATGSFLSGLLGVLLGAIVTFATQTRLLSHQQKLADRAADQTRQLADAKAAQERDLASRRAELEIGNSFVQWQLKQLSELYGPLHALLGQSSALYNHMNRVLADHDPKQFRITNTPPRPTLEIKTEGHWVTFRTVLHIEKVYGQGYGVEDYFSEIVATGERIVKLINEKAGYTRPDQNELPEVFARYLAHYSVLKRLYDHVSSIPERPSRNTDDIWSNDPQRPPIAVIEAAKFPREIDALVTAGFIAIREELNAWRAKAGTGTP